MWLGPGTGNKLAEHFHKGTPRQAALGPPLREGQAEVVALGGNATRGGRDLKVRLAPTDPVVSPQTGCS